MSPRARQALSSVEIGVILGLQRHQRLRAEADGLVEERDVEIGDADVAGEALALRLGERAHRLGQRNLQVRPVHQQKVNMVDAESLQALVDRAREVIGTQVFMRDLGAQEDVRARDAGGAHAFADLPLGAVLPGGVDVPGAELQRGRDVLGAHVAHAGGAEPDCRHGGAMRRQVGNAHASPPYFRGRNIAFVG
jgi:hypothetical protein